MLLRQQAPGADITVTYRGKAGEAVIVIPAERLQRWLLRQLRDEVFAV